MSNGMYDDGGVKFAEEQFAQARARDDEENKRKEKFAKKLTGLNTLIKGVNVGLNFLADDLDAKQVPQKTSYMNFLESTNARRKLLQPYSVADDKVKYVEDYIYGKSILDLAKRFPTIDPISYENYARDYAKNQAPLLAPEFEKMFTELQDIPDQATFETEYSKYQGRTNPRGIFGNVVKLVRNTFKKEDEESITIKNAKAKDAIYGSPMFNEIVGAREAVEAFESKFQTGGSELIESILQAKKEGKLRGKYDVSKAQFIDKPVGYKEDGTPITRKVAVVAGTDIDGAPSIIEIETGTVTQSQNNMPIIYDWDDKDYLDETASLILASFKEESPSLYKKYDKTDPKLMTGLVSRIVERAQNYANTNLGYDKKLATDKAIKDFVTAHKGIDTYLNIPVVVTMEDVKNDSPVSLIMDTVINEASSNNFDDTNIRQSTIDDAILFISGNIDTSIKISPSDTLDNIILLADYIVKNQYISEDAKVEYIEGINNTIMKVHFEGAPLLDIDELRNQIPTDTSDNLNEMQTWEESGNVATVFVQGEPSRKYLNNFDSAVNKLDLSNLSLEELRYLTNIDENLLRNLLGMPKELEFEENPFSIDTRLDEVVKKYRRNNFKKLYDDLKIRNPNLSDSELKKESFKKQPSLEFFEKLRNQLLN